MTDFTAQTPISRPRIRLQGLAQAPHAIRAIFAAFGATLTTVLTAYGEALALAYSASHSSPAKDLVSHEDLGGRDPNW